MDKNALPGTPSSPVLSGSLLQDFTSISGGQQRLFKRIYSVLWAYLWPKARVNAISHAWALPSVLASLSPPIPVGVYLTLSKLWLITFSGAVAIDTRSFKRITSSDHDNLYKLIKLGFISRSSFDPAHPDLIAYRANTKVFVSLTPMGISYYKKALERCDKATQELYIDQFRYNNKKGRE